MGYNMKSCHKCGIIYPRRLLKNVKGKDKKGRIRTLLTCSKCYKKIERIIQKQRRQNGRS